MSPVSVDSGWSGMNNYNNPGGRSDSPYANHGNGDVVTPPDSSNIPPQYRQQNGFIPPDPRQRRPSESGSRDSSRAASIANSRSSDGTISDQQSKKYRRMEQELGQHYAVLRAYLRGGSQLPPRPNKARDKLLRLSPIQFHELSTDVFDELQRRQALIPILVGRRDETFLHSCKSVPISMKSAIRLVRSFLRYRHLVSRIWLLMSFASWSDGFLSLPDLMEVDRSHGVVLALDLRMDSCLRLVSTLLVNQSAAREVGPGRALWEECQTTMAHQTETTVDPCPDSFKAILSLPTKAQWWRTKTKCMALIRDTIDRAMLLVSKVR